MAQDGQSCPLKRTPQASGRGIGAVEVYPGKMPPALGALASGGKRFRPTRAM